MEPAGGGGEKENELAVISLNNYFELLFAKFLIMSSKCSENNTESI